ncbi:hypothetical protein ANCCAN_21510 [Ancylostoma caninum]|uniref:TB2/DP1, HVA22 family n=1 Tax=Ancylostoma caninum TaxID=29170 RepID=A0A368FR52_ANCCA|nr:hypothetical protein ANCCAN_21510 [Ancylostoma caninum]
MESLGDIIHDRIHNQRWFTARGLRTLADATSWSEESLCKVMAGIIFYLLITDSNWIVCNSIVVVVPMLLIYVYPDERPPPENMRVFWIFAFIISAYDRMLEAFPFYYVGKLLALLFLLVEPSCLNEKLKKLLNIKAGSEKSAEVVKKERELDTAKQRSGSALGRFTESLRTALGGTTNVPATASKPTAGSRKATGSLISQPIDQNIPTKTAVQRSRSSTGEKSAPAPTPYDAKPVTLKSKPMSSSGETVRRAQIASGPPVGVGEKKAVQSTYVNLPKPVGKQFKGSFREQRPEGAKRTGSKGSKSGGTQKQKSASAHANIPK